MRNMLIEVAVALFALVVASQVAVAARYIAGPPIDRTCGGVHLEAELLDIEGPRRAQWCNATSGRCEAFDMFKYRLRCPNSERVTNAVSVWWDSSSLDVTLRWRFGDKIALRQTPQAQWQWYDPGYAPKLDGVRFFEKAGPAPRGIIRRLVDASPFWQIALWALLAAYGYIAYQGYFDNYNGSFSAGTTILGCLAYFIVALLSNHNYWIRFLDGEQGGFDGFHFIVALFLVLPFFLIRFFKRFVMGCHYVFVAHPAAPVVDQAHATGGAIDAKALVRALTPTDEELKGQSRKWRFMLRSDAAKARALKEKLDAEAAVATAAVARERARAARND
jgi:hypothetical protein